MNFLGVIGHHMEESGLCELWVECDVLGASAAQNVMSGKGYACPMRTHKLTFQALWQILLPQMKAHMDTTDIALIAELNSLEMSSDAESISQMVEILTSERFHQPILNFAKLLKEKDPNTEFWFNYMEMVSILLFFTRAQ